MMGTVTSKAAQKTFWELKTFPRHKNGAIDDGTERKEMRSHAWATDCIQCGERLWETVSLEFCNSCGHVETDYWHNLDGWDIVDYS